MDRAVGTTVAFKPPKHATAVLLEVVVVECRITAERAGTHVAPHTHEQLPFGGGQRRSSTLQSSRCHWPEHALQHSVYYC
mmetsp:Transcript_87502/g.173659  ORF Transcript_87502/g.173659 Transcript_87502/m.173659 type:complete len:80 (+) Transcript_87502:545-784(+)